MGKILDGIVDFIEICENARDELIKEGYTRRAATEKTVATLLKNYNKKNRGGNTNNGKLDL